MKHLMLWGATVFLLSSCSLQKQTTNTAKTLGIYGAGVIQKPVLTNLEVQPQKFTSRYNSSAAQSADYHRSQAIAKAMIEQKADVIIEPAYETTHSGTNVTIIVTGYAGSYKNFRQLTGADTSLLVDAGIINYNDGPGETPAPQARKKNVGIWVILGLLAAGAAVGGAGL